MILIYTNSGGYGGVEILTQRFIQYLSERNIDFRIAERAGTRLYSMLPSEKIIEPESIERFGKFFSHAFFPSVSRMRPIGHQWEYLRHVKALGWIVHPNEPIRSFIPFAGKLVDLFGYTGISWLQFLFCYHNKLVDHFFRTSLLKQGLIAMDGATVRSLKHFFKDLGDVPYVPIPAPTIAQTNGRKASTPTTHVGYLGRIDAFKMSALKPFLEHSLAGRDVCFHIVGEGPELGHLIELCQRKDIRYINYGFVPNELAREILRNKTDFAVAMGTSALDLAAEGVPCIILDPTIRCSFGPQNYFRFVHELNDCTLGEYRDFPHYEQGMHNIEEVFKLVSEDSYLGKRGAEYVKLNHSPQNIFEKVLDRLFRSELTGDLIGPMIAEINRSYRKLRYLNR